VIRLANLSPEDLFVLLTKIRAVFASADGAAEQIDDDGIHAFMEHCQKRVGEAYFRTPRSTIKEYVSLLSVLEQNPGVSLPDLIGDIQLQEEENPDLLPLEEDASNGDEGDDDALTTFRL
jgi:hypothetical protein